MMEDNNVEKVRRSFCEFFGDDHGVPGKTPSYNKESGH